MLSDAGWSSLVARWAHNPKVAGSNPAPATNIPPDPRGFFIWDGPLETIRLHIEKKNRAGKTVTVLEGFTRDQAYLGSLASRLKQACGTGGTLRGLHVEIQGDFRTRVR